MIFTTDFRFILLGYETRDFSRGLLTLKNETSQKPKLLNNPHFNQFTKIISLFDWSCNIYYSLAPQLGKIDILPSCGCLPPRRSIGVFQSQLSFHSVIKNIYKLKTTL